MEKIITPEKKAVHFENSLAFALQEDEADPLKNFRDRFYIPLVKGSECVYFTGNSLGLQPKTAQEYILSVLEDWANFGVEGHFHGRNPWTKYPERFPPKLAAIIGGMEKEIVVMNELTINLHLLMTTFYRPSEKRYKIICEAKAFPSDQYALQSQVKNAGLDPEEVIIEISPDEGEHTIRNEEIIEAIQRHADEVALVMLGGLNYYSGQIFDMKSITKAAHAAGAYCGFDLAHAAGNVELALHDWIVDFACWCSYKYLNSGPGGAAGAFIHERHVSNKSLPRLAGWWGTNKERRFLMEKEFDPIPTAEGWQVSNSGILNMVAHDASLDIIAEAGFPNMLEKMKKLSAYVFFMIDDINSSLAQPIMEVITPRNEWEHGCQVSILMLDRGKEIYEALKEKGVIVDWREPNVIRLAPVPLYNRFRDVFQFAKIIKDIVS